MKKILGHLFLLILCSQFAFAAVFSINDLSYSEASRTYSFTLTAKATSTSPCTKNQTYSVNYATANGTATAGSDYTATSGTSTKYYTSTNRTSGTCWTDTITVVVNEDTIYEPNEIFYVNLSNASSNATISDSQGVGTIINDDPAPTMTISNASLTEGNSGTSDMTFTVSLSSRATVTVTYATSDVTAAAGSDYTATSGTLSFTEELSKTISVPIIGDTFTENNETFTVTLSSTNTNNSTATATGTIIDNDQVSYTCANPRDFTKASSYNINGNVLIMGNTNMCYNVNGTCGDPESKRNNDINMTYSKDSSDSSNSSILNSSSASITFDSNSTVLWAKVYWQGYLVDENTTVKNSARSILFQSPVASYQTIDATDFNWVYLSSGRFYYQGSADVTSLVKAGGSGYYRVANIISEIETPNGGSFGAWSLVIAYSNSSKTLKNITVFDGYQAIVISGDQTAATNYATAHGCSTSTTGATNSLAVSLSGFLTPTSGDVNSSLSVFAGEGDKNVPGDHLQLTDTSGTYHYVANDLNPYDDIFNSTITYNGTTVTSTTSPVSISPYYSSNSNGIDIDTFDISTDVNGSTLIGNSQTSTTVKLDTSGDGYMPGVFAFSTELYKPDICYEETVTYGDLIVGNNLQYEVSVTNKNYEPAKGVTIDKTFSDGDGISYVTGSMNIAPIPGTTYPDSNKTDATGDDTAEYNSDTNTSTFYLGTGASASSGGAIAYGKITKFKYHAKITDTNINENTYYVSYTNEQLGITFSGVQISKCTDFNNSLTASSAALGKFNVVNKNFSGTTDSNESNSSDNALYTQIVGQDFQVKVLALDSDYITLKSYTGDVNLTLIKQPSYVTDDDTGNQALCEAATSLSSITTVNFAAQSSKTLTLNYDTAYRDVAFKLAYKESNTSTALSYVCSRDSFAIRPATYSIVTSPTYTNNVLTGGKTYTLVATALTNSAATSGYDQNITTSSTDRNATMNLIIPTGCTLDANLTSINLPFSSGTATNTAFVYKNVGDINVTVLDNNWTAIDQNTNSDCIAESNTSTANTTGKVGCLVRNFTLFHFLPKRFNNTFAIANFNSGNFTYLSNDSEMNATASLTATAVLENNTTTATNYTAKCYAQDIDYTIALITNPSSTMWGSNYDTAINRIYFMGSSTAHSDANATGQSSFSSSEGNFTNGSATVTMSFNFDRNSTLPDQPFTIGKTDFNITSLIDSNNTSGTDFNRTDTNTTSLFYYGRAFAPDYTFVANPGTAKIYYEVYCKDCTSSYRTTMGIDGNESVHAINWYQNTNHAPSTMGTIAPVPSTTSNFSSYTTDATANPSTQTLTAASVPLTDKINLNSDTWLQYYPSYYTVTFTSSGNWAGAGTVKSSSSDTNVTGATIDATIKSGTRVQKRLNW